MLVEFQAIGQAKDSLRANSPDSLQLLKSSFLFQYDSLVQNPKKKLGNILGNITSRKIDSTSISKLKKPSTDSILKRLQEQFYPGKPLIVFKNGLINYNYSYRSNLDTPFTGNNLQQHFATISSNILLAQKFPLRVSVYERRSNSPYFKNYTDVRVEFNAPEYRRMQSEKLGKYFDGLISRLQNPDLKSNIGIQQILLTNMNSYLNNPEVIKKYLQSKETIINKNELSGSKQYKDSIIRKDSTFIAYYEKKQKEIKGTEKLYDSLRNKYHEVIKKIQYLKQIFAGNINSPEGSQQIINSLNEAGVHDRHFEKSVQALYAVRTLSVGKTLPDYTDLTVKNIEVNGINAEVNKNNLYTAVLAGIVNFNARDFVLNNQPVSRQYVTAGRVGWGRKEGNHIILTGYRGQKQIFSTQVQDNRALIYGLSIQSQLLLSKNIRLTGEIAQSRIAQSPGVLIDSSLKGPFLKDNSSKAWSLRFSSYFPLSRTRVEGMYEHQGINFQSFNAYKINASTNAWNVKADQFLFSGMMHVTAALNNNDYTNPYVQQNYSNNTVFTTLTATFQKRHWPSISVGYIPSSQYSIINNEVYESRYQAFNVNMNHTYKLGLAQGLTTVMYNRFFNSSKDSGFVYYNANNIYVNQNIIFAKFSALVGMSYTQNPQYLLEVMEAGLSKTVKKAGTIRAGVKLDHLNTLENKFGYYVNATTVVSGKWVFNIYGERSYLPGLGDVLIKNEFINIGFTRYFN